MNGKNLFRALEYVDDRYLDMVDAAAQEATDMKQKHFSGKKTILYILAAAICVSLLTVTAAAAGWIPGIFAAAQPKATPQDAPVLEAAQRIPQPQTPETAEFTEADYTKFTLFQRYYDGKSVALGYDLSGVMPGETVVGFTPEDTLKQEILQRPDNQFWCERYGLTDDTVDQYLEAGVWTREEYDQRLAGRSEYAKKYDLRGNSQIYMDDQLRALLTDGEYKKFWKILGETGSCCVAIPMKPYVGDHILLNGADEPADRGDYTTEEGECLVLNNLPAAAQDQPSITVGLKFKSGWSCRGTVTVFMSQIRTMLRPSRWKTKANHDFTWQPPARLPRFRRRNTHGFDLPGIDCAGRFCVMRIFIITFRSVTFAQRGERLLNRNNHRCVLQRTPKWMEQQGCGYSLRIKTEDIIPVVELLRENGVPLRKIYAQRPDGNLEELTV